MSDALLPVARIQTVASLSPAVARDARVYAEKVKGPLRALEVAALYLNTVMLQPALTGTAENLGQIPLSTSGGQLEQEAAAGPLNLQHFAAESDSGPGDFHSSVKMSDAIRAAASLSGKSGTLDKIDDEAIRRGAITAGIVFRFFQLACAVIAFSVMTRALNNGLMFQDYQAFEWLVAATVIAAAWALGHMLWGIGRLMQKRYRQAWITAGDYVMAWIALSGGAAAAGITTFADDGAGPFQRGYCQAPTAFSSFCARSKAATAFAIITFFAFLPSVAWSTSAAIRSWYEEREVEVRR